MSLNPRVICSVIAILALTACGGADHAISEIDSDIPGEFIVARDSDDDDRGELFVVAADGSEAQAIGNGDGFWGLALSPDGQTVAAVQAAENAQPIVVVDLATGTVSPVAVSAGSYSSPAWSPSGDRFAFTGIDYSRLGGSGVFGDLIYIADTDGSEARLLSMNGPDGSVAPTWSFDGSQVAYVRTSAIWVGRADGTYVRQV